MAKGFLDQEAMYLIVHIVTPHVDPRTKRFTETGMRAALADLGITDTAFMGKLVSHLVVGVKAPPVTYYELMELLCEYICGEGAVEANDGTKTERWKLTAHACYHLFDPPESDVGYVAVSELKALKGKPRQPHCGDGVSFHMHKAVLDYCNKQAIVRVLFRAELEEGWLTSPALALGFVEEVFRLILVERYEVSRCMLYNVS